MASTTFVDGQTLIEASWLNDVNAAVYTPGTITAVDVANTPNGIGTVATDVQAAIDELQAEINTKQTSNALLIALAAQTTANNNVQAYSGADTVTLLSTGTASGNIPLVGMKSATDTLAGLVELATDAEAVTGTDTERAVTPAGVAAAIAASTEAQCVAWVNFNGTGTIAERAKSSNVSLTDNGTGDYTINFNPALADANYTVSIEASPPFGVRGGAQIAINSNSSWAEVSPTSSAFRFVCVDSSGAAYDAKYISVVVYR